MRSRTFTLLGLVSLTIAGVMLSGPTFGFSSAVADRSTQVDVTQDPDAYLGIIDNSENIGRVGKDTQDVYYLDDNVDAFSNSSAEEFTATVVDYGGCVNGASYSSNECPHLDVSLTIEGYSYAVTASCNDTDIKETDTMTVKIRAESNMSVIAERTTISTVETKCNGKTGSGSDGFDSVSVTNISSDGTQTFSFTPNGSLSNGETVTVDLSNVDDADYTNATVVQSSVSGNNNAQFVDSTTIEFTSQGSSSGTVEFQIEGVNVATNPDTHEETVIFLRESGEVSTDTFNIE